MAALKPQETARQILQGLGDFGRTKELKMAYRYIPPDIAYLQFFMPTAEHLNDVEFTFSSIRPRYRSDRIVKSKLSCSCSFTDHLWFGLHQRQGE
jgi:hypothetical protein